MEEGWVDENEGESPSSGDMLSESPTLQQFSKRSDNLLNLFVRSTPPKVLQPSHAGLSLLALRRSLHQMRCIDPTEAEAFVQEVLFKAGALRSQGCILSDEEIMCVLLNGLPAEYSALVNGVDHKNDLTLEVLISSIRSHIPRIVELEIIQPVAMNKGSEKTQAEFFAENVWEPILSEAVVKNKADGGRFFILRLLRKYIFCILYNLMHFY